MMTIVILADLPKQTDSRQQTVHSRQQTADSKYREETADSRQRTADSRQQIADSRQQTADSRQQTADSRQAVDLHGEGQLGEAAARFEDGQLVVEDPQYQVQHLQDTHQRLVVQGYYK
jgi:hypothetical protein